MKKSILFGAVVASAILALVNNLFNSRSVAWFGSPEVLAKPSGWPSMGVAEGLKAGLMVGWKDFLDNGYLIAGGLLGLAIAVFLLNRYRSFPLAPLLRSVLRLGLGIMFIAAGLPKFLDPKSFATLVAQYQLLPGFMVNGFTLWLSAFELVVGIGIILTLWEKEFGALIGLMMVMFIIALSQALFRDLGIACGCFDIEGAQDAGGAWFSLIRDIVLIVPIWWLVATGGRRYLHWPRNR